MGIVTSCLNASSRQLLTAAADGDAETVRQVLEVKPQLASHSAFTTGFNCLHYAAAKGHTAVLQAAVEAVKLGSKESLSQDSDDIAMKHVRAWSKLLKDCLNQKGSRGETPVMVACEEGHGFAARYLIEQGADPFVQDKAQHRSAIHYAAVKGKANSLRRLLDDNLRIHTEEGFVALKDARIQDVSGNCRYIDSRAENGLTALHLAAVNGSLECVRLLLDGGASMMVRTVDLDVMSDVSAPAGSTPLHVAAMTGHVAILQAMLQAHSDALGSWGDSGAAARRAWEGDGRIDLRSVTNCLRQLPYHVAWQKGFRQAAGVLNPTVPIDAALETCRELGEGFGPQKLAVLAAYSLRQSLLVWLKAYKADIELRGLDPRTGIRSHSINHSNGPRSHIERAAAAAVADAAQPQLSAQSPPPVSQTGAVQNRSQDGILDSSMDVQLSPSHVSSDDAFQMGATTAASGRIPEAEPMGNGSSQLSRSLQRPTFSSDAFPSFGSTAPLLYSPGAPFSPDSEQPGSVSMSQPPSVLSSPAGAAGTPQPRRAPPPPPQTAISSPFAAFSPFAQSGAAGFPPLERASSGASSISEKGSNDQQRRPTVRFATDSDPRDSRAYNHQDSGFTELAMGRNQEPPPVGHIRTRSDNGRRDNATTRSGSNHVRSLSGNRSLSRQERAASYLDMLSLPPLPLPAEADGDAMEPVSPVVSPVTSRQHSRHLSVIQQMSNLRRARSSRGPSRQGSGRVTSRQASIMSRAASVAGFEDDFGGDCGICLDESEQVAINGCNHRLCVDCSISLCEVHKKPPLCPFCRAMISGFHEMHQSKFYVT